MSSVTLTARIVSYSTALLLLVSTNCNVTDTSDLETQIITPTALSETVKLVNGEINPCFLVTTDEVESVLGVEVSSKSMLLDYMPSCEFVSANDAESVLLIISAVTDVSIKKANQVWLKEGDMPISAVDAYERQKLAISRMPEIYEYEELQELGSQAFLYKSTFLTISLLKNNIFYQFNGRNESGIDFDALMQLIKIVQGRMP